MDAAGGSEEAMRTSETAGGSPSACSPLPSTAADDEASSAEPPQASLRLINE